MSKTSMLFVLLLLGRVAVVHAQHTAHPLPEWSAASLFQSQVVASPTGQQSAATRSHTGTGLLVGAAVGVAATTGFLVVFCNDPDTQCGIDEVGRATLIIAVPITALGALIGSLIHSEE